MISSEFEQLLAYEQDAAVRNYMNTVNRRSYGVMLGFFAIYYLISASLIVGVNGIEWLYAPSVMWQTANLALIIIFLVTRRQFPDSRWTLTAMTIYLWVQVFMVLIHHWDAGFDALGLDGLCLIVFISTFRLTTAHYLQLYGFLLMLPFAHLVLPDQSFELTTNIMIKFVFSGLMMGIAILQTRSKVARFLKVWHEESEKHRERHRMKSELERARSIQTSMLPPRHHQSDDMSLAFGSSAASEVGGDYCDYYENNHQFTLFIGDVSGHGVAAGIVLSGIRNGLSLLREFDPSPAELLARLNRTLKRTTDRYVFITFQCARFDFEQQVIVLANAGHPTPLHHRLSSGLQRYKPFGLPLGGIKDCVFEEQQIPIQSGDTILFFSDGLFEMMDESQQIFGMARLEKRFEQLAASRFEPERIRHELMAEVHRFMGRSEQFDDITLAVIRIH